MTKSNYLMGAILLASTFGCAQQSNNSSASSSTQQTEQKPLSISEQILNEQNVQNLYGVTLLGYTPAKLQVERESQLEKIDYPYLLLTIDRPEKISVLSTLKTKGLAENVKYNISYYPLPDNYVLTSKDMFSLMKKGPKYIDLTYDVPLDSNIEGIVKTIKPTK